MRRVAILILAVTVMVATAMAVVQSSLKRTGKVGDTYTFDLKANITFNGEKIDLTAKVIERLTAIADDGSYSVGSVQKEAKMIVQGQSFPGQELAETVTKYDPNGEVLEITGDQVDGSTYRFASLINLRRPSKDVAKGDKWEVKSPANAKTGLIALTATYEVEGNESVSGVDCLKINFTITETEGSSPASSKGTLWVNPANGLTVKVSGELKNAPIAGQVVDAQFSTTLVKS